jgi:hypothetical protein
METITINGREYTIEATGLKFIAYKLTSGKLVLDGVRKPNQPDVIIVRDNTRTYGQFSESSRRVLVGR